mmetsp:Transcript_57758/g.136282  ORF Transcript_57758/g.136282 Transcript_57758/m.136282 type:complete len:217 (-) Transcript_57758:172-822(-)
MWFPSSPGVCGRCGAVGADAGRRKACALFVDDTWRHATSDVTASAATWRTVTRVERRGSAATAFRSSAALASSGSTAMTRAPRAPKVSAWYPTWAPTSSSVALDASESTCAMRRLRAGSHAPSRRSADETNRSLSEGCTQIRTLGWGGKRLSSSTGTSVRIADPPSPSSFFFFGAITTLSASTTDGGRGCVARGPTERKRAARKAAAKRRSAMTRR